MIQDLFAAYMDNVKQMSPQFAVAANGLDGAERARVVADYIAGMTDRFAIAAHQGLAG
jgi:dGTPase